jgi:hypothetical protein
VKPAVTRAPQRVIYAADVGSTRTDSARHRSSGFGWARVRHDGEVEGGCCIADLAAEVARDLRGGRAVALGFESPLTIPVPTNAANLCRGRAGEGSRSFAAPVGLAVTALGLHQAAWVLGAVRAEVGEHATRVMFAQRPDAWPSLSPTLFCWEAFVSGAAHSDDHVRDAATAALEFAREEGNLEGATTVHAERPLSVIAAAALWSGWLNDLAELHNGTAVIRPAAAYTGPIRTIERALG